ncbi:MAG: hypothetical protein AB4058_16545 [Microcystaceae cyanobacterium]
MSNSNIETCPVCGVKIEDGDKVIFSSGPVGTRARLWARVCNYVEKPDCINKDKDTIGQVGDNDYYRPI